MADQKNRTIINRTIQQYVDLLRKKQIPIWRVYLFGSYAKESQHADSDIDLAVFIDKEDINIFDENLELMKLTRNVDLSIEPHTFARTDFDEPDPFVNEIITTGERII
jgi:uncharacterized protein